MNFVQPIRDVEAIVEIKNYLKDTNERDYVLFVAGINAGLHISDLLSLRVGDVKGTHIEFLEKETGKLQRRAINNTLKKALNEFVTGKPDGEYLFKCDQNGKRSSTGNSPMDIKMVFIMLNRVARRLGITDNIGTETLRKTFGYHLYKQQQHSLWMMKEWFHLKSELEVLRYIGAIDDLERNKHDYVLDL
ncbi:tyrosine-type recombinase/integrase [Paenibacillus oryzisoli]|uniref:Tyr recombinase domain-containing protein n=1 Tax=Paenibacillus oryzisoli TaxID=1850517 RepID=A0A198A936_9BACL|nr:tyrosine-type recombinase/integrase [Paenibacillus oryzisoli]OAS17468.1 hypothetical protein A8708_22140 [Paenibacillus oryzisoli]